MKITRIQTTSDNGSCFQELDTPIKQERAPDGYGGLSSFVFGVSNAWPSPSIRFLTLPGKLNLGWHHAPARQIVIVLSGTVEIVTGDGEKRRWAAGQAFVADDLTGKGHQTQWIDGPVQAMFIELPPNFDFERWTASETLEPLVVPG